MSLQNTCLISIQRTSTTKKPFHITKPSPMTLNEKYCSPDAALTTKEAYWLFFRMARKYYYSLKSIPSVVRNYYSELDQTGL